MERAREKVTLDWSGAPCFCRCCCYLVIYIFCCCWGWCWCYYYREQKNAVMQGNAHTHDSRWTKGPSKEWCVCVCRGGYNNNKIFVTPNPNPAVVVTWRPAESCPESSSSQSVSEKWRSGSVVAPSHQLVPMGCLCLLAGFQSQSSLLFLPLHKAYTRELCLFSTFSISILRVCRYHSNSSSIFFQ